MITAKVRLDSKSWMRNHIIINGGTKNGLPGCSQEHLPLFCAKPATERMHNEHDNEKSRPIIKPA